MAGMIASFWQAVPNLSNQQVVNFVKQSADRFTNPNPQFGYGIPDFQLALNNALLNNNAFATTSFVISPNPVSDSFSISFPYGFENAILSLYNNLGQNVKQTSVSVSNSTILMEGLQSGFYYYKIENVSYSQSGKIIKK